MKINLMAKYYFEVLDKDFRGNAPTHNSTGCSVTKPCAITFHPFDNA